MPRLCLLDGIVIWINTRDHLPPHFHAKYSGDEVRIELENLTVLTGKISPPSSARCWRGRLSTGANSCDWDLARQGLPHEPIAATLQEED